MRPALPLALLLASCGATAHPARTARPDCTLAAQPSLEGTTAPADLRPRPAARLREPLEIPRDWRALPGTPILWRGPRVHDALVADARTVIATTTDCVIALAAEDGRVRWTAQPSGYVLLGNGRVLFVAPGRVTARDASSGLVSWELEVAASDGSIGDASSERDLLTFQVVRADAVSLWQVDLQTGRVVSRQPCDGPCTTRVSERSGAHHVGNGIWERHDAETDVVVWRRAFGEGTPLARVDHSTLILAGHAIRRVADDDGRSEWSLELPSEVRMAPDWASTAPAWLQSTIADEMLLLRLRAPLPLLVGIDVRSGTVRALQTLPRNEDRIQAIDERTAIAIDDEQRVVAIDLEHVVASPRETLSLDEDIAQVARVIATSRDVFLDRRARQAIDFIARVESPETAPAIAAALASLPIVPASQLARALGASREPEVQQALLVLLEAPTGAAPSAREREAREVVARAIEFPLDADAAARLATALIVAARASRESGIAPRLPLHAVRDLIERASPTAGTLDEVRRALGLDHPRCELPELEAIELAAARHFVELGFPGAIATSSQFCGELRSLHGPVPFARDATCAIVDVEREQNAPRHGLWSEAPSARATFGCRNSITFVRLRFVDGAWRVTDDLGGFDA